MNGGAGVRRVGFSSLCMVRLHTGIKKLHSRDDKEKLGRGMAGIRCLAPVTWHTLGAKTRANHTVPQVRVLRIDGR